MPAQAATVHSAPSGHFSEPRQLRRFRNLADRQPATFRKGNVLVVTDPTLAREILAFKPDIFPETALLGAPTSQLKDERSVIREYTNELAAQELGLPHRVERELNSGKDTLTALVSAALDTFGELLLGKDFASVRAPAIKFSLSRINHHYFRNTQRARDKDREVLQRTVDGIDLLQLEPARFGYQIAHKLGRQGPERVTRLIADVLTGFSIPAVVAACWMLFERRASGLLSDQKKLESENPKRIVMELLRLRPPAWNHGRPVLKAQNLGGQEVTPGDEVLLPVGYIHTSCRHWDDPFEFHAERWLEAGFTTPAYMPFSLGRRSCVAAQLAMSFLQDMIPIARKVEGVRVSYGSRYRIGPLYAPPNFHTSLRR